MKITILAENKTYNSLCRAEHGLSVYIEGAGKKLLFDTGASGLFADNAKARHVNLEDVEACIISHGHYDHTGGVPTFCSINETAPVYIHKDAFHNSFVKRHGEIDNHDAGIVWSPEDFKDRLIFTDGPLWLNDDIVISGTIPDLDVDYSTEDFYTDCGCGLELDHMKHEQFLAVRENGKVYVFSGCSHKGILPPLACAEKLFPEDKVAGVLAGMHLFAASDEMRRQVVKIVEEECPEFVMPVHCTGMEAICMIKADLGDKCLIASTGDRFTF